MNILAGIFASGGIAVLLMGFVVVGIEIGENNIKSEIESLCLTKEEKIIDKSFVKLQISCRVVQ